MLEQIRRHADGRRSSWAIGLSALAGSLFASALWNEREDRRGERRNPPRGRMIEVDGVKLHFLDTGGSKPTVVLIHGNIVTSADMAISGLVDALKERHRVLVFDRPGYGYSDRPRDRSWTPEAQADLLAKALARCKVENAIVFGHSWGALVAVGLALRHAPLVQGVVLASGSYFPTARPDIALAAVGAAPLLGDLMRHTIEPLFGRATAKVIFGAMFHPLPIPARFRDLFPASLSFRAEQLRAGSEEGVMMSPASQRFSSQYRSISAPVTIVVGDSDKVVNWESQSKALHDAIPGSRFRVFSGVGHMVHYAATSEISASIEEVASRARPLAAA